MSLHNNPEPSTFEGDSETGVQVSFQNDQNDEQDANEWYKEYEDVISSWGEKASGMRLMHHEEYMYWHTLSNSLTLCTIVATNITAGAAFIAGSSDYEEFKKTILFISGAIGILTSLIQGFKKFLNCEEKAANNYISSQQFAAYYRYITLQMSLSPKHRKKYSELFDWSLNEYERLHKEAPPLGKKQIENYKNKSKQLTHELPDICKDDFKIKIFNRSSQIHLQ